MEKIKKQIPCGTKEWASSNINLFFGCSHNCRYCYAKKMALRFKRKTKNNWKEMVLNEEKMHQNFKKRKGRVMFPSSHDIIPKYKKECFVVIKKLLKAGNSILITTKPHYEVIKDLCLKFINFKELIQFRFTITSEKNTLLRFWEEGAPSFEERFKSLKFAYSLNYKTSVSIEPFLDEDPTTLIKKIYPFVSETIWVGKMNYIDRNNLSNEEKELYEEIRKIYSLQNIQRIIYKLQNYEKIRYKDSIKKMNLQIPNYQIPKVKIFA